MNPIFRKTLIATALSAVLSTTAIAADDDYADTIDAESGDDKAMNHSSNRDDNDRRNSSDEDYADTIDAEGDDDKAMNHSSNRDNKDGKNLTDSSGKNDSENRDKSEHQDNVLGEEDSSDSDGITKNQTYSSDEDNSEKRNKSKHQDDVLGKEDRKSLTDSGDADEMNIYDKDKDSRKNQEQNAQRANADSQASKTAELYSKSADELNGMDVVDTNGDKVGDVTSVVLSPDQESVHAIIHAGGIMGLGGRDILTSFDDLTLVGDKLQINANKNEMEGMSDYGSENHVQLDGDAPLSSAIQGSRD